MSFLETNVLQMKQTELTTKETAINRQAERINLI